MNRASRALIALGPKIAQTIFSASSNQLTAGWTEELGKSGGYNAQQRRIVTADPRVIPSFMSLTVETGGSGELGELTRQFEFGTLDQNEFYEYSRRSKNGGSHRVTRRTKRQIPRRSQTGWIAYPAASRLATRIIRMYQQIIVKEAHDAIDGGQ